MPQGVRHGGRERELHCAADSSFSRGRDADSVKRGGPFKADLRDGGYHSNFSLQLSAPSSVPAGATATIVATNDSRSRFESKHGAVLGSKRSRLQRRFLWSVERGDDAISELR